MYFYSHSIAIILLYMCVSNPMIIISHNIVFVQDTILTATD